MEGESEINDLCAYCYFHEMWEFGFIVSEHITLLWLQYLTEKHIHTHTHHTHHIHTLTRKKSFIQHFAKHFIFQTSFQHCDINDIRAVQFGLSCQSMIATNFRVSFRTACVRALTLFLSLSSHFFLSSVFSSVGCQEISFISCMLLPVGFAQVGKINATKYKVNHVYKARVHSLIRSLSLSLSTLTQNVSMKREKRNFLSR